MKSLIVLGTLFLILTTIILVVDNTAHVSPGHDDQIDINNAKSEIQRYEGYMNSYAIERGRLVAGAYAGQTLLSTARSGMGTIAISALTGAGSASIANALGLSTRAFLTEHGSTELGSFVDTLISDANTYTAMIDYLYHNTTKLRGVAYANSAMEAYFDACTAVDHYNDHHSVQQNPPNVPIKPPDPQLPKFVCPGVCGNTYTTAGKALSDHYAKCGTGVDVDTFAVPSIELESRTVSQGCGREWYTCEPENDVKDALHRERTCQETAYVYDSHFDRVQKSKCLLSYRNCLQKTFDHNPRVLGKTAHSDVVTTQQQYTAPDPAPTSTPKTSEMHPCGSHTTDVSGDHTLQASCTSTDSNGNSCTVTSFYACDNHTHVYPSSDDDDSGEMLTCQRPGCSQSWRVGDRLPGCFFGDYPGQDCLAPALTKECINCGQQVPVGEVGWYCDDSFTTTHAF